MDNKVKKKNSKIQRALKSQEKSQVSSIPAVSLIPDTKFYWLQYGPTHHYF